MSMNETTDLTNEQQPSAPEVSAAPAVESAPVQAPVAAAVTPAPAPAPAHVAVVEEDAEEHTGRGHRKVRIGAVVSNKMQKSILVTIERRVKHPLYKKYFTLTTRLMAHDEKQEARIGDIVKISETRPLSKRKCWRLVEIIERAK